MPEQDTMSLEEIILAFAEVLSELVLHNDIEAFDYFVGEIEKIIISYRKQLMENLIDLGGGSGPD